MRKGQKKAKLVKTENGLRYYTCSKCKGVKAETDFNKHARNSNGLRCDCRECQRKAKARYLKSIGWRPIRTRKKPLEIRVRLPSVALKIQKPVDVTPLNDVSERSKFMKKRLEMIKESAKKYKKAEPEIEPIEDDLDDWTVDEYADLGPDDWGL